MKPAPFTYHRPTTLGDAVTLLTELAPHDGRVLAGGQSLVPIMAFRLAYPAHLIDINAIAGLDYFADATLAGAFVARWCVGSKVETAGGVFQVREDEPAPRVGARLHRTP